MSADTAKEKKDEQPERMTEYNANIGRIEIKEPGRFTPPTFPGHLSPYSAQTQILAELRAIKSILEKLLPTTQYLDTMFVCAEVVGKNEWGDVVCGANQTYIDPSTGKGYCQVHHR